MAETKVTENEILTTGWNIYDGTMPNVGLRGFITDTSTPSFESGSSLCIQFTGI